MLICEFDVRDFRYGVIGVVRIFFELNRLRFQILYRRFVVRVNDNGLNMFVWICAFRVDHDLQ